MTTVFPQRLKRLYHNQSGAPMIEYVIATAILVSVFAVGAILIEKAGRARGDASMNIENDIAPCKNLNTQWTDRCL